jgi:primosomal protein N' (replication factor Y)
MLNYPDFRAFERSYQMLSQVSGRAGRRTKQGKVIIQAYDTSHRIISQVVKNDYEGMFDTEILERRNFHYPPLYRLIQINVKHKDLTKLLLIASSLAKILRSQFGDRVLGPEAPMISRIRNYYIQTVLLKVEREGVSIQKIKEALQQILVNFDSLPTNKGVYMHIDVDPY